MFERTHKVSTTATESEFVASSSFSEGAKLHRKSLQDFVDYPYSVSEIKSKGDYFRHIITPFSDALKNAGYNPLEVDSLLKQSFEKIDFKQEPEKFVDDINRLINNFYKTAPKSGEVLIESSTSESPHVIALPQVLNEQQPASVAVAAILSNKSLASATENQIEQSELINSEHAAEFAERKIIPTIITSSFTPQHEVLPLRSESEVLQLTNVMPVADSPQPEKLILENPLLPTLVLSESDRVSEAKLQLEKLNEEPFDRNAYLEFTFEKHSELRSKYDAVLEKARQNLKRYSALYTPSKTEKEALQFMSSLQGQYAKMQRAGSETGVRRAELMNSLNRTDEATDESEIKDATANYIEQVEKILMGVNKLEGLLEIVESEDKATIPDFYRAQLELMQTDAQKILTSLPTDHPRYDEVKKMVEVDLMELVNFVSVEENGDKNLFEQSSAFMSRREHIQIALDYLKKEHDYKDFISRKKIQLDKHVKELDSYIQLSPEDEVHKQSVINDVVVMRKLINAENSLPNLVPLSAMAESTFNNELSAQTKRRDELMGYLGSATVILEELRSKYPSRTVELKESVLSDEEWRKQLEKTKLGHQIQDNIERYHARQFEIDGALTSQHQILESRGLLERWSNIISKIPAISVRKIGKVAGLGLALAATPVNEKAAPTFTMAGLDVLMPLSLSQTTLNSEQFTEGELWTYLRSNEPVQKKVVQSETVAPGVVEEVPVLPVAKVVVEEVVPGVVFNTEVASQENGLGREVFSDKADKVPSDRGITFSNPEKIESTPSLNTRYEIVWGDTFWDINEGQSIAGKLPVMSKINSGLKQALIKEGREAFNKSKELRDEVGGFGKTADDLITGQTMNLQRLNEIMERIAVEARYL